MINRGNYYYGQYRRKEVIFDSRFSAYNSNGKYYFMLISLFFMSWDKNVQCPTKYNQTPHLRITREFESRILMKICLANFAL